MQNDRLENRLDIESKAVHAWITPSPHICELLRKGAERALVFIPQADILKEMAHSTTHHKSALDDDPILMAATRRANRSSLMYWLNETINHPERPVTPHLSTDMIQTAREASRLGEAMSMLSAARTAQAVAWQYWMKIIFQLTQQPSELQQLLEISSRSINDFVDGNLVLIQAVMKEAEAVDAQDFLFHRREWVSRILEGEQVNVHELSRKLNYPLDQAHHAAIIWSEAPDTEISLLEQVVTAFLQLSQQTQSLKIVLSTSVIWLWVPATTDIDQSLLAKMIDRILDVKITFATGSKGLNGFRKAHFDALTTQRVLGRLQSSARCISYEQIRLAALMSRDPEALNRYNTYVLGDLLRAPVILQQTLLCFLENGCNIADTAVQLNTHRNTVIRRLAKAEELLPQALNQSRIHVGAALEVLKWEN